MSRLTRDGTAEPVSRDQILRHERGQENIHVSRSADHVQDWQLTGLMHTLAICVTIHTSIRHRVSPEFIGSRNCVSMAFTAESPPAQDQ